MDSLGEHFYEAVFRNVGFVLIAADADLTIRGWNEQAARVFGGRPERMLGTPLLEVFPAEYRPTVQELLRAALERGLSNDVEFKHVGEHGQRRTFVAVFSPVLGSEGRPIGVSVAMRDITKRKQLSQQLAASRRMTSLGMMANGVAHHFNNILGGVLTSIDAALSSDNPRVVRRTLERVAESVGRASRITQQLLAFSTSEAREGEWVDLNHAVAEIVRRVQPQMERRGLSLETQIEPVTSQPFEANKIYPILESVAQNSIDAMKPGGRMRLLLTSLGDEALIVIEDTGSGIPATVLEHIFEPFFTTKGSLGGGAADNVGLGLSVVQGLVGELGGRIDVSSQIGVGTRVEIHLPLSGVEEPPRAGDSPLMR
ncbi:MAG: PAS domain-containing protein [Phycisphaerae bacterium]|nr:PAS domain-containing protein [Phycisphaerae bacterium]